MKVFGPDGQLQLAERIGKGGEGEVYLVSGKPDIAVKIYTLKDLTSRQQKIAAMINARLAEKTSLVAYPKWIVQNERGAFSGFAMSRVSSHEPLHELYSTAARKQNFAHADYRFLTRAAANISRAVASVHAESCVIGDFNHSGVLVSSKATVALIDADSFQIVEGSRQHLCKVGVPDYTPPELQGQRLDNFLRTPNHDAFGLAVAIFHLLWLGRHPFAGRFEGPYKPMETAIKELRFAYSIRRQVGMSPPPAVPLLSEFPAYIQNAFEAAFGPAGITQRPTAAQWVQMLEELERGLKPCAANVLHFHPAEASECPWCRMERLQGVQLFVRPYTGTETSGGTISVGDLDRLWRAIEAIQAPSPLEANPALPSLSVSASADISEYKSSRWQTRLLGAGLALGGVIAFTQMPQTGIFCLMAIGFGAMFFINAGNAYAPVIRRARDIEERWLKALYEWEAKGSDIEFVALKASLSDVKKKLLDLPNQERRLNKTYQDNRQREQLRMFLDGYRIRQFKITGVGPSKLATLASYGIETAADIDQKSVLAVPGFGPTNSVPLLEWRKNLASRFVYDPRPNAHDQKASAEIKAAILKLGSELRSRLGNGPNELRRILIKIEHQRTAPDAALVRLHEQRLQALADLKELGLTMPSVVVPRPATPKPSASYTTPTLSSTSRTSSSPAPTRATQTTCPSCGRPMLIRQARRGRQAGRKFWGCTAYPSCRGTRKI